MQFKIFLVLFVFMNLFLSCSDPDLKPVQAQIIPAPTKVDIETRHFILSDNTGMQNEAGFEIAVNFLKEFIADGSTISLGSEIRKSGIYFVKDNTISTEGYALKITQDSIQIRAKTDQGAFYAVQSLRQLLPVEFENGTYKKDLVAIQCVTIEDNPQFSYRGMHLDVGRHFFPVAFIKKYIDAIAMLKMNTFHWHLTEDQGWRLEIKKYPKLNEIAAYRSETLIGHYRDQPHQFDGKRYGGYYTQDQVRDIVTYAQSRQVTIIPEIEMPGHSQAVIAAYPELGCTGNVVNVATKWGVFEDIYCSKEETFEFIENVLDEVLTLFPSKYIHIGGDEAPKANWKACEDCQNRIQSEGLKDEHELQNYFITRIEKYLNSKGRQIIGWDEILEGGLAPNATVMSWRGTGGAVEAAKQNHNVILTPTSHCYFDYYQSESSEEPLAIGGFLPLEKVYHFNPVPEELSPAQSQFVLGAQGNVWTEYMPDDKQVEYMVFPRILAMSEVVWSAENVKSYPDFVSRVENFNKRLNALDINYANHLFELKGQLKSEENTHSYELSTLTSGKDIHYTVDGSLPISTSEKHEIPIRIDSNLTVRAAVFTDGEQLGEIFTQELKMHKAVGKTITMNVEPHKAYNAGGKKALLNSISGSDVRFGDKEWLGFWGDDLEISIDLGEPTDIVSVKTRFFNSPGQWIHAPKTIQIAFDDQDAMTMTEVLNENGTTKTMSLNTITKARFIKLMIRNYGMIPEGQQGAGNPAWTFIDEIIVN